MPLKLLLKNFLSATLGKFLKYSINIILNGPFEPEHTLQLNCITSRAPLLSMVSSYDLK